MGIREPNFTSTPNEIIDEWLPKLKLVELRVLMVIIRKTFGWHKVRDRISISQLCDLTGSRREDVINATESLKEMNLITKEVVGENGEQKTFYTLIVDSLNNSYQSENQTTPQSELRTPPSRKYRPTKETLTKEKKENINTKESSPSAPPSADAETLYDFFLKKIRERESGFKEPNSLKWKVDLDRMLKLDKREVEITKILIEWASTHNYWSGNCLSPANLRKNYDAMMIQMKNEKKKDLVFLNRCYALSFYNANRQEMPGFAFHAKHVVNTHNGKDIEFSMPHEQFKRQLEYIFGGE